MSRAVLATIFLAACSFQHGAVSETPDGGVPAKPTADAPIPIAPATCHTALPGVRLCLDFEGNALAQDTSGLAHTVDISDVTATTRGTQGAASLTSTSTIFVEPRSDLDISPRLSMEMWISVHSFPSNDAAWLVSSTDEYGLWLTQQGLSCGVSSRTTDASSSVNVSLPLNQWTHVACVYDGSTLKLYVNGSIVGCDPQALTIDNTVGAGVTISSFDGAIDDVHLYASAITGGDVCHLATGGALCKSVCPPSGPGP